MEHTITGVGVLDKAVALLRAIEERPRTHAELTESLGWSRATTHRLAVAMEAHGLLTRDAEGRFDLGLGLVALGQVASARRPLAALARPVLDALTERTGESAQLYVRDGESRVCVAAAESPHGLRTIVPLGAVLTLDAGSAAQFLRTPPEEAAVERGWSESVGQREAGVASVSAPVHDLSRRIIGAVSVSGPIERTTRTPGEQYSSAVLAAAAALEARLRG